MVFRYCFQSKIYLSQHFCSRSEAHFLSHLKPLVLSFHFSLLLDYCTAPLPKFILSPPCNIPYSVFRPISIFWFFFPSFVSRFTLSLIIDISRIHAHSVSIDIYTYIFIFTHLRICACIHCTWEGNVDRCLLKDATVLTGAVK